MSQTNTSEIFNLPPLVLPKMSLDQVLAKLRPRINQGYMPSATGERTFNSKPDYVKFGFPGQPHIPFVHEFVATGYFVLTDMWGHSKPDAPVWLNIQVELFQILINLKTEETWVHPIETPEPLVRWENRPEQTLPINPYILEELLEIYL